MSKIVYENRIGNLKVYSSDINIAHVIHSKTNSKLYGRLRKNVWPELVTDEFRWSVRSK